MTFKITAAEKKAIIKRRQAQGQDGYSDKEIMGICKQYSSALESMEGFGELEEIAISLEEGETELELHLKKAVQVAYNLQEHLNDALTDIANKSHKKYGKFSNKFLIKLSW